MPGRKLFTRERFASADVNDYLMEQAVMRFDSAAAREAAIPAPELGMVAFLETVKRYYWWDGDSWNYLGGAPPATSALAVTGFAVSGGRSLVYSLDGSGFCSIEGALSASGAFTAPSATIATLPSGARPESTKEFPIASTNAGSMYAAVARVTTGGLLTVALAGGGQQAAGTVYVFDNIRYRATQ